METSIFEDQTKQIISEIKQIIDAKRIDLDFAMKKTGISKSKLAGILAHEKTPSLPEFFALCEISGITFNLPAVETPDNPM